MGPAGSGLAGVMPSAMRYLAARTWVVSSLTNFSLSATRHPSARLGRVFGAEASIFARSGVMMRSVPGRVPRQFAGSVRDGLAYEPYRMVSPYSTMPDATLRVFSVARPRICDGIWLSML